MREGKGKGKGRERKKRQTGESKPIGESNWASRSEPYWYPGSKYYHTLSVAKKCLAF